MAGNGAGTDSALVGSFQVKLSAASDLGDATTNIVGKVYDGAIPAATIWEKPQVDGACTLTTPRIPFCNTPCSGGGVCVEDDTCMAYPAAHGVGTVTVSGVKTADGQSSFTMMPIANNYQPTVSLLYPPFAEGDSITVAAAGDFFPAFNLASQGIAPLVLTSTQLALKSGQALDLAWSKAASDSTVHVHLDISHHGGSKGQIECDTDDSGSLRISAALVSKLLALGVAGYPTVIVTRQAIGATKISAGRVELVVSSAVEQGVSIDGLTSCTKDADCASGQTCQSDQSCK
ncbi:MAG TPA: hypothetical protein VGJ91_17480 [Polyangiaceae bacterium]|jgi:hypothetical protein